MFGNERPRRITKRESRSAIPPAIESDTDQSADQQEHDDKHPPADQLEHDDRHQSADQLEVTDQLSQSYSTLLKSLTEAYQTMFHTHDHEDEDHDWLLDGDRHHDHDHAEGDHDSHGHDLSEGDADGDEDALSGNTTPASRRQPRKNQTSWLGQHLTQNHRHHDHHHHHRDGHHDHDHGQEEGMTPARTWLSALASMLVISLMGLLAVCCLPLLQGPRFESCKFFMLTVY
jgi:hypothetical protein